jgi:hypothetical protein
LAILILGIALLRGASRALRGERSSNSGGAYPLLFGTLLALVGFLVLVYSLDPTGNAGR